jgi:hypothetical protein
MPGPGAPRAPPGSRVQLLDGVEAAHPQQVLLRDPDEAPDAAVAVRARALKGRRTLHAYGHLRPGALERGRVGAADPAEPDSAKQIDLPVEPLFPLGHGLSYTRFVHRNLRARPAELRAGEAIPAGAEVANEAAVAGQETKIALEPSARNTLGFELSTEDLTSLGPGLSPCLEPGASKSQVGRNTAKDSSPKTIVRLVAGRTRR